MDATTLDRLRSDYDVIPIARRLELGNPSPADLFDALNREGSEAFLLESVVLGVEGRFSFLGVSPRATLSLNQEAVQPAEQLREVLKPLRAYDSGTLPPFFGGAVGFLGYGTARWLEKLPDRHPAQPIPEATLLFFDDVIAFDHVENTITAIANIHAGSDASSGSLLSDAERRLEGLVRGATERRRAAGGPAVGPSALRWESNCSREEFLQSVRQAKEAIAAGEAFQIVVSQRWDTPFPNSSALALYRALREVNPSPYMFLLQTRECTLVGASPEMLVRVTGRTAETRPIAGTRPRGRTAEHDAALEAELLGDEKENAEHLMLVDLGRNDLGRVSERGSVSVSEFRTVERYSHVMHLVSHVTATVRPDLQPIDVLLAAFPAGTVTGAPKIRAMELIDDLEFSRRGPYAGAVLYASYAGDLDSCITIRTVVLHQDRAYVQAGAGVVFDSVPEREYDESVNKAAAMMRALEVCHAERSQASGRGSGATMTNVSHQAPAQILRGACPERAKRVERAQDDKEP